MKKKTICALLSCVLSLSLLAGCGNSNPGAGSQPAAGDGQTADKASTGDPKTIVVGISTDLKTLDPGHMYEVFGNLISYATYDMLFRIEGDNMAEPQKSLVKDYTLDDARTTYTFTLRDDVKFTSGNPLTSGDVAWTINRVRNLKSNTSFHAEGIKDVQVPDAKTVVIQLKAPDASFIVKLASNAFCILDSELLKTKGGLATAEAATKDTAQEYLNSNSAGSGPFKLVSWVPSTELVLEKNENYWGKTGNVDRVILKEIPDSNTQIQMLEKGEIDVAFTLNSDNIGQLEGKAGIKIIRGKTSISTFLLMNNDPAVGGPLANPDVQQAVRLAIDYKGLMTLCGQGALLPLSIVPDGFVGALQRSPDYTNLDKSKELLAKAGYAEGFEIKLTASTFDTEGMSWVTIAQKIQADLAKVGIKVKVETGEIGVVLDAYRNGTCPFLVMHWSPDYYDINNQLAFLPGETVGVRANWQANANPALNELGNKIIGEPDPALRAKTSEELQKMMAEASPYAFLLQHPKVFAISDKLDNVVYNDLNKLQLADIMVK